MAVVDLTELYEASYGRLVAQLYALCGDMTTAEDAVQDAFVTALRKSRELAHVHSPEAWIRTVAVNRLRAGWRHAAVVRRYLPKVPARRSRSRSGRTTSPSSRHWRSSISISASSWCCTTWPTSGPRRSPCSWGSPRAP